MSLAASLFILLGLYVIGQYIGKITKGYVSATLFVVFAMLFGFISGALPKDIVATANLTPVYSIVMAVIVVNVGTMIEPAQFKVYWRVALTCVAGLVGLAVVILGIGGLIFGSEMAWAVFPTLSGSLQATAIVTAALKELDKIALVGIVSIIQSAQGWFGIPIISYGTRLECKRLLVAYRSGETEEAKSWGGAQKKLIDKLPARWDTPFLHLFIMVGIAVIANWISKFTAPITMNIVGSTINCLVLGFIFRQLGLIGKSPLAKAGLMEFSLFAMVMGIYANLANLSVENLIAGIVPIIVFIVLGAIGMGVVSIIVGKMLKLPVGICLAAMFGAYQGFPLNYQVASDTIDIVAENDEEKKYLKDRILDSVLMGSITSVTVLSLVIASVVVALVFS